MKILYESLLGDMETAVNNNCVYYPKNKDELTEAIKECLDAKIYDLSCIDTSNITDMSNLFDLGSFYSMFNPLKKYKTYFNKIDISKWNVSKNANTDRMFDNCPIEEKYKPKFK